MRRSIATLAFVITLAGCAWSPETVSTSAAAYEAALAVLPAGLVVAWYDTRAGNADIYFRELDRDGYARGPERRLTSGPEDSYEASVDAMGEALAAAWYDKDAAGLLTARVGVWELTGAPRWSLALGPRTRNPVVRAFGKRLFCAWIAEVGGEEESVWAAWWDAAGQPVVQPVRVGPAGKTTWNLNAAVDADGAVWVVYDAQAATTAEELFVARMDERGVTIARVSSDDGKASKYPDLAIEGELAALTWFDEKDGNAEVYLAVGALSDLTHPIEVRARRVTDSGGESIGSYVAWNRDRVGLAWSDDTAGQHEVFLQEFGSGGEPMEEPRRITTTPTSSLIPAIRAWRKGFVLAWNEYQPADRAHDEHGGSSYIAAAYVP